MLRAAVGLVNCRLRFKDFLPSPRRGRGVGGEGEGQFRRPELLARSLISILDSRTSTETPPPPPRPLSPGGRPPDSWDKGSGCMEVELQGPLGTQSFKDVRQGLQSQLKQTQSPMATRIDLMTMATLDQPRAQAQRQQRRQRQ